MTELSAQHRLSPRREYHSRSAISHGGRKMGVIQDTITSSTERHFPVNELNTLVTLDQEQRERVAEALTAHYPAETLAETA